MMGNLVDSHDHADTSCEEVVAAAKDALVQLCEVGHTLATSKNPLVQFWQL
jgi:hypothetical protein